MKNRPTGLVCVARTNSHDLIWVSRSPSFYCSAAAEGTRQGGPGRHSSRAPRVNPAISLLLTTTTMFPGGLRWWPDKVYLRPPHCCALLRTTAGRCGRWKLRSRRDVSLRHLLCSAVRGHRCCTLRGSQPETNTSGANRHR